MAHSSYQLLVPVNINLCASAGVAGVVDRLRLRREVTRLSPRPAWCLVDEKVFSHCSILAQQRRAVDSGSRRPGCPAVARAPGPFATHGAGVPPPASSSRSSWPSLMARLTRFSANRNPSGLKPHNGTSRAARDACLQPTGAALTMSPHWPRNSTFAPHDLLPGQHIAWRSSEQRAAFPVRKILIARQAQKKRIWIEVPEFCARPATRPVALFRYGRPRR